MDDLASLANCAGGSILSRIKCASYELSVLGTAITWVTGNTGILCKDIGADRQHTKDYRK
jgi:hypothetical protein